jgi:hypothetical protein
MNIEKLVKSNHSVSCYNHGNKRLRLGVLRDTVIGYFPTFGDQDL